MLLQFSVENFLSFREPQVLSMLAADGVDHPPHMVMEGPEGKKVLRCAAIYGANASGKSNLVKALEFGTRLVLKGTRAGEGLGVRFFRLDATSSEKPASFQWELDVDGSQFSYGFEISDTLVLSEWLFVRDHQGESLVFEREGAKVNLTDKLTTNPERTAFLRFVAQGTRPNQLFLGEARERNVFELANVWGAFEACQFVQPDRPLTPLLDFFRKHPDFADHASDLLRHAGTGVETIRVMEDERPLFLIDEDELSLRRDAQLALFNAFARENSSGTIRFSERGTERLMTFHPIPGGASASFSIVEESDGTQRLLDLAPPLYLFEKTSMFLAVDELERSLHPLLTRAFLSRIVKSPTKSQLLFTTHDTNLLDLTLLSRDAIWFTEKDPAGATVLYSLAEYKEDQISQLGPQLEKGYLQGRFGAIPFLGDASRLGWKKAAQ